MSKILKNLLQYIPFFLSMALLSIFSLNGCDDSGIVQPTNNANVITYDSIWVEEDSAGGLKLSSMNLFNGVTLERTSNLRDVDLNGDTTGTFFYLSSGFFETKFFQAYTGLLASDFDTIASVNGGAALDSTDFTNWGTDTWGTWVTSNITDPHSVYCFWLKGRQASGQNSGINIFGLIQPRQAVDLTPGIKGGFRMSFRVRINKNGENDFRQTIGD